MVGRGMAGMTVGRVAAIAMDRVAGSTRRVGEDGILHDLGVPTGRVVSCLGNIW